MCELLFFHCCVSLQINFQRQPPVISSIKCTASHSSNALQRANITQIAMVSAERTCQSICLGICMSL